MAVHRFRVRRSTEDGVQVTGFFASADKAITLASRRMRETGSVFRVERRNHGACWETALELVPETKSGIEAVIARGHMPKVQDVSGRKGRVLSCIRPTREVRVAWLDVETVGKGEVVPVDSLSLRQ